MNKIHPCKFCHLPIVMVEENDEWVPYEAGLLGRTRHRCPAFRQKRSNSELPALEATRNIELEDD